MENAPGWYPDPWGAGNLRWWQEGRWTGYTAVRRRQTPAGLGLALLGLVAVYFPLGGFALGIAGAIVAIRALRRDPDRVVAIVAVSLAATDIALSVSGFGWSLMTGLYGIVTFPWPN